MRYALVASITAMMALATPALGEGAEVVDATASRQGDGTWRFDVTVRHEDTGWENYADAWDILTLDGQLLGQRVLVHPHVDEQPFTRSLSGVKIPSDVGQVVVRARDNVDGYSGNDFLLELPQ